MLDMKTKLNGKYLISTVRLDRVWGGGYETLVLPVEEGVTSWIPMEDPIKTNRRDQALQDHARMCAKYA